MRTLCFGRVDVGRVVPRVVLALREGDLGAARRLADAAGDTSLAWLISDAVDAVEQGAHPGDLMRETVSRVRYESTRGFRAIRAFASLGATVGLIGAMAHWFYMLHGDHGVRGLSLAAIREDAMRGASTSMLLGLGTSLFVWMSAKPLAREAMARRREIVGAAQRLVAALDVDDEADEVD